MKEPKRRGATVRDNDGNTWKRANTLWHHISGRDEWRGRWPFYAVERQFGPLLLLDDKERCNHGVACTVHPDQDSERHGGWEDDEFHTWLAHDRCVIAPGDDTK